MSAEAENYNDAPEEEYNTPADLNPRSVQHPSRFAPSLSSDSQPWANPHQTTPATPRPCLSPRISGPYNPVPQLREPVARRSTTVPSFNLFSPTHTPTPPAISTPSPLEIEPPPPIDPNPPAETMSTNPTTSSFTAPSVVFELQAQMAQLQEELK